jgi:hypothetical protein
MDIPLPSIEHDGARLSASPAGSPKITDPDSPVHSIHGLAMTEAGSPHATNFFDDASTDDGETGSSAPFTGTRDATPEAATATTAAHHQRARARYSADSQTVPLHHHHFSTPQRSAPSRPPRPPRSLDPTDWQITPEIKLGRHADWGQGSPRRHSAPLDAVSGGNLPASSSRQRGDILSAYALTVDAILRSEAEPRAPAAAGGWRSPRISIAPPAVGDDDDGDAPPRIKQALARGAAPYPIGIRKSFRQSQHDNPAAAAAAGGGPPRDAILALTLRRRRGRRSPRVGEVRIPASLDVVTSAPATPAAPGGFAETDGRVDGAGSSPLRGGETKRRSERHFETLDFDDAYLFRALRAGHARLAGPLRGLSARGLRAIKVTHSSSGCRDDDDDDDGGGGGGGCRHHLPRSPVRLVASGLSDPCSEAALLSGFRAGGRTGRAQYMWVHWAHRIASTPPHLAPAAPPPAPHPAPPAAAAAAAARVVVRSAAEKKEKSDVDDQEDKDAVLPPPPGPPPREPLPAMPSCVAGLEFVEGWAAGRIAGAVGLVLALAVVAALLWIFEGFSPRALDGGFHDAAGRVASGCVLGVFILLLGLAVVGLWALVSWLAD